LVGKSMLSGVVRKELSVVEVLERLLKAEDSKVSARRHSHPLSKPALKLAWRHAGLAAHVAGASRCKYREAQFLQPASTGL
jgi:hypothetical protein